MTTNLPKKTVSMELGKNIFKLATGTAFSQAVVFATTPILTRYYSPRDFGVAAFFMSLMVFFAPLCSLNYHQAIVLPKHDRDALGLGRLSLFLSLVIASLLLVGIAFGRGILETRFQMPELIPFFWLIPAAILVRSLYLVLAAFMSRYRQFSFQAKARILQTLSERSVALGAAFTGGASSLAFVFARVVSTLCETAMLLVAFLHRPKTGGIHSTPAKPLRELAGEYRDFPLYANWSTLLANGSAQLPIFLLPAYFAPSVTGFYALGVRLIQLPMQLLGESIRTAYYKEVTDQVHAGENTKESFENLRHLLVRAGMFPFAILLCFGHYLFGLLFGAEWVEAGTYAGILGFFFFFQFTSTPNAPIFNAYRKQKHLMIISGLLFANNLISLSIGVYYNSPVVGLALMSAFGVVIYLFMNYLAEKAIGANHLRQFILYGRVLLTNLPFIAAFFLIRTVTQSPVIILIAVLLLSLTYYGLLFRRDILTLFAKSWRP